MSGNVITSVGLCIFEQGVSHLVEKCTLVTVGIPFLYSPAQRDQSGAELRLATLAYGSDTQCQKRVDGILSTGVDRRAGASVSQCAARGPDIPLEEAVVGWAFGSDV